uniref:Protein shisa-1-like n=1 Tax=Saccoglossus kowalevskii TaxID=10224 RepID=A0ABM0GJM0_SACKO|nr:PREDICTED: protein shisa-1-like [Saccoglossus kowalevskii]
MVAMQLGCVVIFFLGHLQISNGQRNVSVSSSDQGYCESYYNIYGVEQQGFYCPQEYDLPSETYCCGEGFRYCCDYDTYQSSSKVNLDFNWNNNNNSLNDLVNDFTEMGNVMATSILTIVGVICGIIAIIIIIVVIVGVLICTGVCCRTSTHDTTIIRNSAPPPTAVVTSSQMYAAGTPQAQTMVYQQPLPAYYPPQQQHMVYTSYSQAPSSTAYTVKV